MSFFVNLITSYNNNNKNNIRTQNGCFIHNSRLLALLLNQILFKLIMKAVLVIDFKIINIITIR